MSVKHKLRGRVANSLRQQKTQWEGRALMSVKRRLRGTGVELRTTGDTT